MPGSHHSTGEAYVAATPEDLVVNRSPASGGGWEIRRYAPGVAFERFTTDPDVMGGMPTVRGLRIPVATVVAMVADGMTAE